MIERLDKIFNFYTLLLVNIALIWVTELAGHGHSFYDTGAIHGIAILFIILALTRLFGKYYIADPILKMFLNGALAALLIFSISHFVEFLSFILAGKYNDALFANVANFYILSLLCIIIGAEYFLQYYFHRSPRIVQLLGFLCLVFLAVTVRFLISSEVISLELENSTPYLYSLIILAVGAFAIFDTLKIGKTIPLFSDFSNSLVTAIILIIVAAVFNIFYDLHSALGVDEYQFVYLSHFTFYAAISAIYLSFSKLTGLTGLHKDMRDFELNGEVKN